MKSKILLFLLSCCLFSFYENSSYRAIYKINFVSNLDTKAIRTERAFLIIEDNQKSSYTTENTYKQDSIMRRVKEGLLTAQEVMNDKLPKTGLNHFVQKNYNEQNMTIANLIAADSYIYNQKNELNWQLSSDTLTIKNYVCNKATVRYEGRDYIAWYTTEIPIPDGPYKFWGLPGLIIKIYDTENEYAFTLESFEKYIGKQYPIPYQTRKTYEVSYEKFKDLSKEFQKDFLKSMENRGLKIISIDGQDPSKSPIPKRNSIERY